MGKYIYASDDIIGKDIVNFFVRDDEAHFFCSDGSKYKIYHEQDCCESVSFVEEKSIYFDTRYHIIEISCEYEERENDGEHETDTKIFIYTDMGLMILFWNGHSNGYYGEGVTMAKETNGYYSAFVDRQ